MKGNRSFAQVAYCIRIFIVFIGFFMAMKIAFMLYNQQEGLTSLHDIFNVLLHGLPLDISTAGYLVAFPFLLLLTSCWFPLPYHRILRPYFALTALVLSIILCADCGLYPFWQFKLDATVFNYLDSPRNAMASVSTFFLVCATLIVLTITIGVYLLLRKVPFPTSPVGKTRICSSFLLIILGGLLFLGIRGGVGKSTMNIGTAYFSNHQFLNHSAVNPAFNLLASALKTKKLNQIYRFFPNSQCRELFNQMGYDTCSVHSSSLLSTNRPNIVLILLEGFGASFIEPLQGEPGVTPQFNKLAQEGILFTQCYANSFRTDRGTVCALSGYPSYPQISVMKLPEKTRALSSIAKSLSDNGYQTDFLYGGDINFTNMKSYLLSTGYQNVQGDTYFPSQVRETHAWGVTDCITFDTLYHRIATRTETKPRFTTFLTLASHEPWKVPYNRIKNNIRTNAMAYTDHCIGLFINRLKQTPQWNNLLVIFIADHSIGYPAGLTEANKQRYHIPMLWVGGAVKQPKTIRQICNQSDLPATLLGQMGISHGNMPFSRDVLSESYTYPLAIHTFDNGFALIDSTGYTVQDFNSNQILTDQPQPSKHRLQLGHAFLQTAIDDLDRR